MSENILEKQLFEIIKDEDMAEHIKLAKLDMLIKLGVDVNALYGAKSALKLANELNEIKIAKMLKANKARDFIDEEKAEELGQELIKECGQKEINFEKVKELINKGADIEAKDNNGYTSLIWASSNGHSDVVKVLLEKGADIEAKNVDGDTSLIWASYRGCSEAVKLLLEKGADIEAKDEDGQTSLMWASRRGHSEVVELLLEKGADIEAKDNRGKTALDLVENDKVKKMLEDARNKNSFLYKIKKGFGMGD